ncbi:MAG: diguanylate cyclase [Armatimonadota bacterium]|nr:diguanylate cyclase [Armatimonadota bacterium]MDR7450234.1 diguanylate cyclase [Armatimonadota bacterium]MDR7460609.1 diguanylate cyclase [Armatimonadota bacterium]MDR7480836.1 diguanylate cyclase [Armatimonadota bacterium]MDR7489505.1 diguanylate cyclase [Armatimonadota bacterium]
MSLSKDGQTPRILVVDDEPSILSMLRLRLESMGAAVVTTPRGAEALALARTHEPDLVLLDVMMPDVDGFTVIGELKADPVTREIPVIFMTARDEVDSRIQGLELGGHDYVTKPFNTAELLARVRAALRVKALQDELREKNRLLEQLASSDPLTALPNRRTFDEQVFLEMERARRSGQPLSVLLFDIDDFKQINARYGHQSGDEVLRRIGRVLAGRRRAVDLVARYGGEEFVWLLPGASTENAMELAEWLRRTVAEETVHTSEATIRVSISIGVSTYVPAEHGDAPTSALLEQADRALREAKAQGKARAVFRPLTLLEEQPVEEDFEELAGPYGPM